MRSTSRFLLTALFALSWSGLATANPSETIDAIDASVLRSITNVQLDAAFESFVSKGRNESIHSLAGPTSMDCTNALMENGIETCVVSTNAMGPIATAPAALAQH